MNQSTKRQSRAKTFKKTTDQQLVSLVKINFLNTLAKEKCQQTKTWQANKRNKINSLFTVSNILVKYCPGVHQSKVLVTRPLLRRVKVGHIQPEKQRRQQKFVVLGITVDSSVIVKLNKTIQVTFNNS